jgi:hypothetical protein
MKLIAHRGLLEGPNKELENTPNQILKALDKGFDCEVDLWYINGELFLGHDGPQYFVDEKFINSIGLWIHAKNLAAFRWLTNTSHTYFWHQEDDFTLTSNKFLWTYPGKELTMRSISVLPEWNDPEFTNLNLNCYAICSDYVERIKNIIK